MSLAKQVLRWSGQRFPRRRLNAAITALMLKAEGEEARIALDGITHGRYQIDEDFVEELFNEARPRLARLQLARSHAFIWLSPARFKRLYVRLWRTRGSTAEWRYGLAWSLQMFLRRHPDQGHAYAPMVSLQMRDRVEEVALLGLFTAGYLGKSLSDTDAECLCTCVEQRSLKTMSALNALTEIYRRWAETPEPARRVLSSRRLVERVEQLGREGNYQLNASYCIRAMRKALRRSSRG